ncbi:MAG: glycosyltransferase family 1 protein [Candidatus Hydrothermarchaeota archaeon]
MYTIGIFTRWNATCGVSMHAEIIAKEFIEMGYDVKIFAPYVSSANKWWHHKIIRNDEDYIIRCYQELDPETMIGGGIDEDKIISEDLDYLIVESYSSLPYSELEHLVKKIKEKTKVVAVIHEGKKEDIKYSNLRIFDAVVAFDHRYKNNMIKNEQVRIIPYPCYPVSKGNRRFGEEKLVFFSFGRQPPNEYKDYIEVLKILNSKYDLVYEVIRSNGPLPFDFPWLKQKQKKLENDEIYKYLHSSDIHLLPKGRTNCIVVSSTLSQCLGSLTPTVVPNTKHFELLPSINGVRPVIPYQNVKDLRRKIEKLVDDENYRKKIADAAKKFVEENRSDKIAQKFIMLYEELK